MTGKDKSTNYTLEQIGKAEQMARALTSVPKDRENILVTMTNVFISGMEAGAMLKDRGTETGSF